MAPGIMSYLGLGGNMPTREANTPLRALPANWYNSSGMYELERRAIFSKKWMLITHEKRLSQPGDWLKYTMAGFQFVLSRDRHGEICAFHNICRHRAFPVVVEDQGTSKIFACKYHGWSYALNGKLAKAPGYDELEDFKKEENNLFPIHVRVDSNGFIWINLDGKKEPDESWEDAIAGTDQQERYKEFNLDDYVYDHSWKMEGGYNWKILADNYNECYHCATSHPDIGAVADLRSYTVAPAARHIIHNPGTTEEQRRNGLSCASTFFFPSSSTTLMPHFLQIQRWVPLGPTSSSMQYEVFRNKNSSQEEFDQSNQIFKRIMSEDKYLCENAQRNLNSGTFVNGEMHPRLEMGPLHFQKTVREIVTDHHAREQAVQQEIWPTRQTLSTMATASQKDMEFCSSLSCQTNQETMAW